MARGTPKTKKNYNTMPDDVKLNAAIDAAEQTADLDHWRNLSPEMTDDFIRIIDEGKRKAVKPTTRIK